MCCCSIGSGTIVETVPGFDISSCTDPVSKVCPDEASPKPVRYGNGALIYDETDLSWRGLGFSWSHSRSYANLYSGGSDNGDRWLIPELSSVSLTAGPHANHANHAIVIAGANTSPWFHPASGGGWVAAFGGLTYLKDPGDGEVEHINPDGSKLKYYSATDSVHPLQRGKLKSITNRNGVEVLLDYFHIPADGRVRQIAFVDGAVSVQFIYDYLPTGDPNSGRLLSVTQMTNNVNLSRVIYHYHVTGDPGGSTGDLKDAVVQEWDLATNTWLDVRRSYYRYHTSALIGNLKLVIGSAGCRRLEAAGIDPDTASDTTLLGYSDFYFEYDSQKRVILEKVHGGSETYTYSYVVNIGSPGYGDVNTWAICTTETMPNNSRRIVYSNSGGKPLLNTLVSADEVPRTWNRYRVYNGNYQTEMLATPDAEGSISIPHSKTMELIRRIIWGWTLTRRE